MDQILLPLIVLQKKISKLSSDWLSKFISMVINYFFLSRGWDSYTHTEIRFAGINLYLNLCVRFKWKFNSGGNILSKEFDKSNGLYNQWFNSKEKNHEILVLN